jgi:SET domain-containing protein/rubisco large subunit methyltransferase-like protein
VVAGYLQRLSSWLVAAGGHHEGVEIRELGETRGVVATRPITRGSEVVRVPRSLLITLPTALGRLEARQVRVTELALSSENARLAVWLLVERGDPRSGFQPYFDTLPRSLARFPINAASADRALLDGSLAGAMLDRLRADLEADHAKLVAGVAMFRSLELDELVWARLCVGSRSFGLGIDGRDATALVPFVDMVNHERGPNTRWDYDPKGQAFLLIAQRAYQPGEEVCCNYGGKPNAYLLLHYGFCLDDNDADEATLSSPEQVRVTRNTDAPVAQLMLAKLRARYRDEAAARAALADAAHAGLARFLTTLAEDQALLAAGNLSADARNFIVTRLGEKRVLHAWLELATGGPAELFRWPA